MHHMPILSRGLGRASLRRGLEGQTYKKEVAPDPIMLGSGPIVRVLLFLLAPLDTFDIEDILRRFDIIPSD